MDNQTNTCSMCGTPFNSQDEVMSHAQTAHPMPKDVTGEQKPTATQETFKCNMCSASFSTKAELENHAKDHQTA